MGEKPPDHSSLRSLLPRSPAFTSILHPSSLPYNEENSALPHLALSSPDFPLIVINSPFSVQAVYFYLGLIHSFKKIGTCLRSAHFTTASSRLCAPVKMLPKEMLFLPAYTIWQAIFPLNIVAVMTVQWQHYKLLKGDRCN